MTPEFEKVLDPLIARLLDIVQKADQMPIRDLTVSLRDEFDQASKDIEPNRQWTDYARYALVAWVDSELIATKGTWKDDTLEAHYFKQANAYSDFFLRAEAAYEKHYFDAFEVFYICFMFGFHGIYQAGDRTVIPKSLPDSDADWQKKAAGRIARIRRKEKQEEWDDTSPGDWQNQPLYGQSTLFNNAVFFGIVLAISVALSVLFTTILKG